MAAPIRPQQKPKPAAPRPPLDPALLRLIEALAEADADRDYDAFRSAQPKA